MEKLNQKYINSIVKKALEEDLRPNGDITTNLISLNSVSDELISLLKEKKNTV